MNGRKEQYCDTYHAVFKMFPFSVSTCSYYRTIVDCAVCECGGVMSEESERYDLVGFIGMVGRWVAFCSSKSGILRRKLVILLQRALSTRVLCDEGPQRH